MNNKKQLLKKIPIRTRVVLLFLVAVIVGLGIFLSPGEIDYNASYHPFKSTEAKEEFLALYDKRAEQWPVPVETKMVDTTHGQTFVRVSGLSMLSH